jgi:hypothetical protein
MVTLVRIGEEEAAVSIISDKILRFTTPAAAAAGTVDVTVVTDHGEATLPDSFEYTDEAP